VKQGMAKKIGQLADIHGFTDFKWMNPGEIITGQWVRTKCAFGCPSYGRKACCPPQLPPPGECRNLFADYRKGIFFHLTRRFKDSKERYLWGRNINTQALALEREVFLLGFPKAFIFLPVPCNLCEECRREKTECRNPLQARPTLEGFCVDVFSTAGKFNYPIRVLKGYGEETNRYGALLVE
jgi:predicted metal-binding protein